MNYHKESWKRLLEAILTRNASRFFLSHKDLLQCLRPAKKKGALVIIKEMRAAGLGEERTSDVLEIAAVCQAAFDGEHVTRMEVRCC